MSQSSSNMVRALVLRELEAGKRDDGLWLQAMSESKMDQAKARGGVIGALQRARWAVSGAATFVRLYFMPVKHHSLPAQVRMVPAW